MQAAKELFLKARNLETRAERRERHLLSKMANDESGRAFVTALADQLFRSKESLRGKKIIRRLLKEYGIPKFLPLHIRILLRVCPSLFFIKEALKQALSRVLLKSKGLYKEIRKREEKGYRVNLNHLGEAILGEGEARRRLNAYLEDLKQPEVNCISVKISTLYSQINLLDRKATLEALKRPYRELLHAAKGKMVNLDMEEYRDLALTVDLFIETLKETDLDGGIALQAYIPDSFDALERVIEFAKTRKKGRVKVRLVKGANLLMEQMEARLKGLTQAPYAFKSDTDAHFLKMVDLAICKENASFLNVGIGSHNLFDIVYAIKRAEEEEMLPRLECEMLEGIGGSLLKAVSEERKTLLYTPAVSERAFPSAVGYLLRRVEENTSSENFLSRYFSMEFSDISWRLEERRFEMANQLKESISSDRRRERLLPSLAKEGEFANEPDSDWIDAESVKRISLYLKKGNPVETVEPLSFQEVERAIENAEGVLAPEILLEVAKLMRKRREELIAAMVFETKKIVEEADTEISEAIDFLHYYYRLYKQEPSLKPVGLTLVAPPWNFPLSIATSGIASAVVVGAPVLFKPAPEARFVGKLLAECFFEAGVSRKALQFIPCEDEQVGVRLIQDTRIKKILLTGSTETARLFLALRPGLDLSAETGGKNALIVTGGADRDLAVRDIIRSAFSHAGQKCSALSLLILERELYEDADFLEALKDAAESLKVGKAEDLATKIPPLIKPPEAALKRALTSCDEGEFWFLQPKIEGALVTPGIKMGVKPGSFSHVTEFFGPHLSVMCAEDLEEALRFANQVPYGLTAGIHTLDSEEIATFLEKMEAGNLYLNRTITGAIVRRQPFGGTKDSSFGLGFKIGGPNSLRLVARVTEGDDLGYEEAMEKFFRKGEDPSSILGQENILCYRPRSAMLLLLQGGESQEEVNAIQRAAYAAGTALTLSEKLLSGFSRIRALLPPKEEQLKEIARSGSTLLLYPFSKDSRTELLYFLREVAISYDTHRYGLVTKKRLKSST